MELISVIVPIYKAEAYFERCITSIVQQSYVNLEIILIDDGSPDRCPELCDEWAKKDKRIIVVHQKNKGISGARNAGIRVAKGKYIVMVDSDDYIAPQMFLTLYEALINNEADLAICDFEKGFENQFNFFNVVDNENDIISAETALKRIYDGSREALKYVAPWGKLYKKTLFDGIEYPEGKIFEDIYITHQILFRCNKIVVNNQKLVYYFQHPSSIMNETFHVGKLDYLEALKNRIQFYKEHRLESLVEISYDEYLHSLIWEYSRARDLLANKEAMQDIIRRYREIYKNGYSSKRYPKENKVFLWIFFLDPELIIWYWRISAKIKNNLR